MMAVNVTQKDETLKQIIRVCKSARLDLEKDLNPLTTCIELNPEQISYLVGQDYAYAEVISACESMLGYTGTSMPLEVPNQSEDARQEAADA